MVTSVFCVYVYYSPDSLTVSLQIVKWPNMGFINICITLSGCSNLPVWQWCSGELLIIIDTNIYFPVLWELWWTEGQTKALSSPGFIVELLHAIFLLIPLLRVSVTPALLEKCRPECSHTPNISITHGPANTLCTSPCTPKCLTSALIW